MKKPSGKPPSEELLFEAVELRSAGLCWEAVAERLHRAVRTVRRWPLRYPERWQVAIDKAEMRHVVNTEAETIVILRSLARASPDDRVRAQCAKALLQQRLGLGKLHLQNRAQSAQGATLDKAQLLRELLERYSDDELAQLAREGRERTECRDGRAEGAVPTSAA